MNEPISPHPFPADGATTAGESPTLDMDATLFLLDKLAKRQMAAARFEGTESKLGKKAIHQAKVLRALEAALPDLVAVRSQLAEREQENARLSAALAEAQRDGERAVELLAQFVDDDACRLDHHGECQTHRLGNPCEVAEAKAFMAARSLSQPEPQ